MVKIRTFCGRSEEIDEETFEIIKLMVKDFPDEGSEEWWQMRLSIVRELRNTRGYTLDAACAFVKLARQQ